MIKIMTVDDDPHFLFLVEKTLKRASGYKVITCSSGEQALEIIEKEKPHVVLIDVMMPGMDGFEVCRRIKAIPELKYVSLIMLSAKGEMETRLKAGFTGADDYIAKPVFANELLSRIRAQLRIRELEKALETAVAEMNDSLSDIMERTKELQSLSIPEQGGDEINIADNLDAITKEAKKTCTQIRKMAKAAKLIVPKDK